MRMREDERGESGGRRKWGTEIKVQEIIDITQQPMS